MTSNDSSSLTKGVSIVGNRLNFSDPNVKDGSGLLFGAAGSTPSCAKELLKMGDRQLQPIGESRTPQTFKCEDLEENDDILNTSHFTLPNDKDTKRPSSARMHPLSRTELKL